MSMSVPYTPPDYVPPEVEQKTWSGPERRSRDPINQLSRSFNRLCLEASDRFEIIANLEALGFNSPTALHRLGVDDHFELGNALYARTPRTFERKRPAVARDRDWLSPIAMVLALLVTFGLGAYSSSIELAPAIWVLVWSQVAAALLSKARGELDEDAYGPVLSLLLQLGLVGVLATWVGTRFDVAGTTPAVLWFSVAGLLWGRRYAAAFGLPLVSATTIATGMWLDLPPEMAQFVTIALALALVIPPMSGGSRSAWLWAARRMPSMTFAALYGLGQGVLIVALLRHTPAGADVVPGAALLAAILLSSRAMLLKLKEHLSERLWRDTSGRRFIGATRWSLLAYTGVYLAPVAVAGGFYWFQGGWQPWFFHWLAFALFGLCLALAVVSWTLGDAATPGLAFVIAGAVALSGSFLLVCTLLAATQLVLLLVRSSRFERYAVFLV